MEALVFPGTYTDEHGSEKIEWRIGSGGPDGSIVLDIATTIRGVPIHGHDLDTLEAVHPERARAAGLSLVDATAELTDCVVTGEMPCLVETPHARIEVDTHFSLRFQAGPPGPTLRIAMRVGGAWYEVADSSFENCLERIDATLPPGTRLTCCLTCRWSAYQQYATLMLGMRCNRDARQQHLAARNKHELDQVRPTEQVPETYLCPQYELRDPPTAQRAARLPLTERG